ncbi:hypothetical protein PMAYCL1PPCAC_10654, partial [Pristionchus mayeri]
LEFIAAIVALSFVILFIILRLSFCSLQRAILTSRNISDLSYNCWERAQPTPAHSRFNFIYKCYSAKSNTHGRCLNGCDRSIV